jgi:hypothetical protein
MTTSSRRRRWWIAAAVVVPLLLVGGLLLARELRREFGPVPSFPALTEQSDPGRVGTIAFIGAYPEDGCVWVAPASGVIRLRKVGCVRGSVGSLAWRDDGTLEGTRFIRSAQGGSETRWIADVRTGTITDVPGSEQPPSKIPVSDAPRGPNGEVLEFSHRGDDMVVRLRTGSGSRTLATFAAPTRYTLGQVAWSADGSYAAVHDSTDRVLLITTGADPQVLLVADRAWAPAVTDAEPLSTTTG